VIAVMKLRVLVVGVAFVEMVVMIVERSGGRVGWQEGGSVHGYCLRESYH